MSTVKAVVIKSGDAKPSFKKDFPYKEPTESQVRVKVLGTSIHHLVRGRALGKHYSVTDFSGERLIGVDGAGVTDDGKLVYFTTFEAGNGSFAEYVNVDKSAIFPFPSEIDIKDSQAIARVAALSNPGMSSSLVFGSRLKNLLKPGFTVAINGVTGSSGGIAVEISKKVFGASKVIGVGRSKEKLESLAEKKSIDDIIALSESDEEIIKKFSKHDVDVVLDYTWGKAAEKTLLNLIKSRKDSTKLLSFVQIGQIGGTDFNIPPGVLRSQNLLIIGSGIGSFAAEDTVPVFSRLTESLAKGDIGSDTIVETAKACDIDSEWDSWDPSSRKVFTF